MNSKYALTAVEADLRNLDYRKSLTRKGIRVYNYAYKCGYRVTYPDGTKYWYRYPADIARSIMAGGPLLMPSPCWVTYMPNGLPHLNTVDWSALPW